MSFQHQSVNFSRLKVADPAAAVSLALRPPGFPDLLLIPIGPWILDQDPVVRALATWRFENKDHFFARFPYSHEGMRRYLENFSLGESDRILFLIKSEDSQLIGHLGLAAKSASLAEVDAIMLAPSSTARGVMFGCLQELIRWSIEECEIQEFELEVLSTNDRAIKLYQKLGFREVSRSALRMTSDGEIEMLVDCSEGESDYRGERVIMELKTN